MKLLFALGVYISSNYIGVLNFIALRIKLQQAIKDIKRNIFKNNVITENEMNIFMQLLLYTQSIIKEFNCEQFSNWFKIINEVLIFDIECDPIHLKLYFINKTSYHYELFIKSPNNEEFHYDRDLRLGLDEKSQYLYDNFVYQIVKNYINASISIIKETWANHLKNQVRRILWKKIRK